MKAVVLILACVGLASAGSFIGFPYGEKVADADFLHKQKTIFDLFEFVTKVDHDSEYYKIGHEFNFEANFDKFKNVEAVKEFYHMYKHGMLPKGHIFSIFYEKMREEAIALFHVLYYANDFETFYKTACWARVHMNEGMFLYSFSVAVLHRVDMQGIILPAPYEVYPWFFVSTEVLHKMYREKMQGGIVDPKIAEYYGIFQEGNDFIFYSNYTGWYMPYNHEQKLAYFTEDIGLNSYYYYFHLDYPFWMGGEEFDLYKDRRGELYYYYYQQLLARYYMERLSNGMGEIYPFSWTKPIKYGYQPSLQYPNGYPFNARQNNYEIRTPENIEDIQFVTDYETEFLNHIDLGYYKTVDGKIYNFSSPLGINDLGNYFQRNPDFFNGEYPKNYNRYYEVIARVLLGTTRDPVDPHYMGTSVLEQFSTSLRDPVFWQFYSHVVKYFIYYKKQLPSYTEHELSFPGVKIESFEVDKLVTYFDYFDFDASFAVFDYTKDKKNFIVRQPRLNHKPFNLHINVDSEKDVDAVVKIFIGPNYESFEKGQYYYFELDSFIYKLRSGKNSIVRDSKDFFRMAEDRTTFDKLYKMTESGKLTLDMSEAHNGFPERLLLPKGTKGGFPFRFFVFVYPYVAPEHVYGSNYDEAYYSGVGTGARYFDAKPFGYPFDRPVDMYYFLQPNMYYKDIYVYHEGPEFVEDMYKYHVLKMH